MTKTKTKMRNRKNLAALFVATSAKKGQEKCVEDCEGFGDNVGRYEKSAKLGGDCNELFLYYLYSMHFDIIYESGLFLTKKSGQMFLDYFWHKRQVIII